MNYKLSYPAIAGEAVTEGHIAFCEKEGHASCYVDGVRISLCPRCGTDVAIVYKAESAVEVTESVRCWCEHTDHFYGADSKMRGHACGATLPGTGRKAKDIGSVCSVCAETCMVDYLI